MSDENVSVELMRRQLEEARRQLKERDPLHSGGGGGTFDGMEARVKALEERVGRFDDKLDKLIEKVAGMEGEMRRLPGYPGLFLICGTLVGVVALIVRFLPAPPA